MLQRLGGEVDLSTPQRTSVRKPAEEPKSKAKTTDFRIRKASKTPASY